ncbi:hypothetical protein MNV49_003924 [Pseudohyphozyma bogoriensis]|nr:hypothetical protein MNV49_003924 [Pseudohyphozyma bogoriensis]
MTNDLKNVLVIGFGPGGVTVAKELAAKLPKTHRVVAVSEHDFAYNPIGTMRASTVPGWETKVTTSFKSLFNGTRHVILGGTRVVEFTSDHSVLVDKRHPGFELEIHFDYVVIATGSTYAFPARAPAGMSESQIHAELAAFQKNVAVSSSILVVGGGATGIEFAGEVAAQYPGKKVVLAHTGTGLFTDGFKPKLGQSMESQLKAVGVELQPNSRVNTKGERSGPVRRQFFELGNGHSVEADFIYLAYGCVPNSSLLHAYSPSTINKRGFIKVQPSLQVTGHDNFFAIGDVNDVPEDKLAVLATWQAPIIAANVVSLIAGKAPAKKYTAAGAIAMITVGPNGGAGQAYGFVMGSWLAKHLKAKDLGIPKFVGFYSP